jgi:hypothetical protein
MLLLGSGLFGLAGIQRVERLGTEWPPWSVEALYRPKEPVSGHIPSDGV